MAGHAENGGIVAVERDGGAGVTRTLGTVAGAVVAVALVDVIH
jgi:hypothetical protein